MIEFIIGGIIVVLWTTHMHCYYKGKRDGAKQVKEMISELL